jgi:hypothetical protein
MVSGILPSAAASEQDWLTIHATLLVGIVGILVSGLVGPTVTAAWTTRRERTRDHLATVSERRDDLRVVIDEAAKVLGNAVSNLRLLLAAREKGDQLPAGPTDLLRSLVPLGQRLRLRLPEHHSVIVGFEASRKKLIDLSHATKTQAEFDRVAKEFEAHRESFLDAGRDALQAPISTGGQI